MGAFPSRRGDYSHGALKCQISLIVQFNEARMRLKNKIAIAVGAGQSPGEGLGNGRATVLRFAQEGAKILAVDNNLSSAEETVALARQGGGECVAFEADVTAESTLTAMIIRHGNVGAVSTCSITMSA
jgi:NADP-dependent 3-hydroxy acid dehydrogenase YdfG